MLQQYLPFTVLKPSDQNSAFRYRVVATVLTVYGIETINTDRSIRPFDIVATVLTVYGIETTLVLVASIAFFHVATVLTVYGIETFITR